MAISRMNMERQMRNMGGIMGLEDQRQGYFLGKLVKKITKPIKKIAKSPLGKAALLAGGAYLAGGFMPGGAGLRGGLANFRNFGGGIGKLFAKDTGLLRGLVRDKAGNFSLGRAALSGLGAASIAAPFFMGGEEEEDTGTPFGMPQPDIEDIRSQAKAYYSDPTNSALYFMPPKSAVQKSFYAAEGGLASLPRDGYRIGGGVLQKAGQMIKSGVGKVKSLFDDADISVQIRDDDVMTDAGLQAQAVGQDVFITPKSNKAVQVMEGLIDEGYDIAKAEDGSYTINALDEGALDLITQRLRIGSKGADEFIESQEYFMPGKTVDTSMMDEESKMIYDALRNRKADGGLASIDMPKRGMVDGPGSYAGKTLFGDIAEIDVGEQLKDTGQSILDLPGNVMNILSQLPESFKQLYFSLKSNSERENLLKTIMGEAKANGGRIGKADGGIMDLGGLEKDYREGGFVPLGAEERADDVPARLSKNEFVFTADAVRAAGQGDIDQGAEVMQNMMDNLESGGTISEESQGMENPAQSMFDQAQQLESRIE